MFLILSTAKLVEVITLLEAIEEKALDIVEDLKLLDVGTNKEFKTREDHGDVVLEDSKLDDRVFDLERALLVFDV
jgi:hypothetical protein